jgi:hypothetical protein
LWKPFAVAHISFANIASRSGWKLLPFQQLRESAFAQQCILSALSGLPFWHSSDTLRWGESLVRQLNWPSVIRYGRVGARDAAWNRLIKIVAGEALRTRLMFALGYDGALRREELCVLGTSDFDPARQLIRIRAETTKNRLERIVLTRGRRLRCIALISMNGAVSVGIVVRYSFRLLRGTEHSLSPSGPVPGRSRQLPTSPASPSSARIRCATSA